MSRRRYGASLMALGAFLCFSDSLLAPAMALYWKWSPIDRYDAAALQEHYARLALAFGAAIFGLGILVRRLNSRALENFSLTAATLALIVLGDRILLLAAGTPLWIPDVANHYRHRPGAVRSWANGKQIRIDRYGFRDDDFPVEKSPGEFRGVMLGDSVTMGHAVSAEEAFPHQLEELLRRSPGAPPAVKIINAAVQGYSTFQEANVFRETLRFQPDFAAVGFCMNDVTEPYVVDRRFGGSGLDYHGVLQLGSQAAMDLANETGIGRVVQKARARPAGELARAKGEEVAAVAYMAGRPADDPKTALGWKSVFDSLDRMRATAREGGVRLILLVFPFTFQLFDADAQVPQRLLLEYGRKNGLEVVDFTPVFERRLSRADLRKGGLPDVGRYFIDEDHFTPEGHRVVAERLLELVERRGG